MVIPKSSKKSQIPFLPKKKNQKSWNLNFFCFMTSVSILILISPSHRKLVRFGKKMPPTKEPTSLHFTKNGNFFYYKWEWLMTSLVSSKTSSRRKGCKPLSIPSKPRCYLITVFIIQAKTADLGHKKFACHMNFQGNGKT